jgi:hypothetical protein
MSEEDIMTLPTDKEQSAEAKDDNAETTTLTNTNPEKRMKRVKKVKKRRPARPQVDPATFKTEPPPQTGTIFNIWYNKWSGGDRDTPVQQAAPNRCNIEKDSGYTRADSTPGAFFCLFFARGICPRGKDCQYLHRLPGLHDIFNPNVDCFGRDKFADYRDDMGGVGSFMRQNRTLYVGRIHVTDDIEEVVARHFQEWGQIDRTRVLNTRGVAFVTYTNLANSEFAKEAMAHQSLDHDEVLNVRWATVDPNPAAQKREARAIEEQAAAAIRAALPPDYVAELEGRAPESNKRRKIEGTLGLEGYEAPDDIWWAREKSNWLAEKRGLEGGDEQHQEQHQQQMIEQAPVQEEGGIFSSSTLAALKGRTISTMAKKASAPAGPLVGYGSDSDEDD